MVVLSDMCSLVPLHNILCLGCVKHTLATMLFNASKCKCVVCSRRGSTPSYRLINTAPRFFCISDNSFDVVDSWSHLGHIICQNYDDNLELIFVTVGARLLLMLTMYLYDYNETV